MKLDLKTIVVALPMGLALIFAFVFISRWQARTPALAPALTNVSFETQSRGGGDVMVEVTPVELTVGQNPRFDLTFDTHSEDLDFDVSKISTLTDNKGNVYMDPAWDGSPPGGHHRQGRLTFISSLKVNGKVKLLVASISGVSREFSWIVP